MPPKRKRLEAKDFKNTEAGTRSSIFRASCFDIKILFNKKGKFACVVKNNIAGSSVIRNKIRRKVYSTLTTVFKDTTYSVIAYPKKQTLTTPFHTLVEELQTIKKEIKI